MTRLDDGLAWIMLVPWLLALDRTSMRGAIVAGVTMAIAFVLAVLGWFATSIGDYAGVPGWVAFAAVVVLAPFLEPQFVTFAVARRLVCRGGGFWRPALCAAGVYVGTEWAVPRLFGDTLGFALYPAPWLRQAADLAGPAGLTFLVVIANEASADAVERALGARGLHARLAAALPGAARVAAVVLALAAYGAWREHALAYPSDAPAIRVGVVQANMSHYDRLAADVGRFEAVRRILDGHFALSNELLARGDVDVLVWPETVYPTTFGAPKSEDGAAFDREISGFAARTGVPLVFGSYAVAGDDEFNAAIFLEPRDGPPAFAAYRKATLFPLTERVPRWLDSPRVRTWLPWLGTWKPGSGGDVLPLRLRDDRIVRVAPLICYDDLAPRLARAAVRSGAGVLIALSNDSWFGDGPGGLLHLVGAAFRSIETRRPQVRATNTGISAIISPTGAFVTTLRSGARGTLAGVVVPESRATTLALAWGDWFGPTALVLGLVLLVPVRRRPPAVARKTPRHDRRVA